MSSNYERQKENFECFDFTIDKEDMEKIRELDQSFRFCDKQPHLSGYSIFS